MYIGYHSSVLITKIKVIFATKERIYKHATHSRNFNRPYRNVSRSSRVILGANLMAPSSLYRVYFSCAAHRCILVLLYVPI